MPHLSLNLLGGFNAALDGEPLTAFETDKTRALLAILATDPGRPRRRAELIVMLWPNSSAKRASRNLSQTLLRLRRALQMELPTENPYLLTTRQNIQFNPDSNHQLDVARFKELIRAYRQHHHTNGDTCSTCVQWLEQAATLYHGEFLDGFFVRDSDTFEEWRLAQQEELHREIIEALTRLTDYFERQGQYQQVLTYARQHPKLEAWSDSANLQLMQALVASGKPAEAIKQYEAYTHLLAQKLNISPAPEVTTLYEQIKRDGMNGSTSPKRATEKMDAALSREELRPVTILVCKWKALSREEDAEAVYAQHALCEQRCENIVNLYGGHRLPLIGERCLITFGYPKAQEDAPRRAVNAALAMISGESRCGQSVGIGIHTGTMLIRNKRNAVGQLPDLLGNTPDIARGCQNLAQPGTVLITEAVERLIRDRFECKSLGDHRLASLPYPLGLFQVPGEH